ncbi:MAG: hypothetical protein VKJ24_07940 [Synechococcales bacterium]|nr:hypothetical protein [Synechococcales bacterium]
MATSQQSGSQQPGQSSLEPAFRSITVQAYFKTLNWTGTAPTIASNPAAASQLMDSLLENDLPMVGSDPLTPLPLSLSVSQFLTAVNWDGLAMIEASNGNPMPSPTKATLEEASGYTLNDFSDLF